MIEPIHIISLGAGVQSSTMALMAAAGEITPMPKCAIFADTQAEPKSVYTWLDWLEKQLPFAVNRVTRGSLRAESLTLKQSKDDDGSYVRNVVPAFTLNPNGTKGMLLRKCTTDFKLIPLQREQRRILKESGRERVISWIGISTDEASRMKESRVKYIENRWPLVELGMTRNDCLIWIKKRGFHEPPKSACSFCPYHNDYQWRRLKSDDPEAFRDAVEFELDWNRIVLTDSRPSHTKGKIFLHRSCKPLSEVDFSTDEERGQLNMFNNECEGMCGV